jgi:hypothetical protein
MESKALMSITPPPRSLARRAAALSYLASYLARNRSKAFSFGHPRRRHADYHARRIPHGGRGNSAGDRVQLVLRYVGNDPAAIIHDLLTSYAGVLANTIDLPAWQMEVAARKNPIAPSARPSTWRPFAARWRDPPTASSCRRACQAGIDPQRDQGEHQSQEGRWPKQSRDRAT